MITLNKRMIGIVVTIAIILLVPFIAMQFTSEVNWTLFDFLIAAVLLFIAGFSCEYVLRKVKNTRKRVLICLVVLAALLAIWAELAVGIFGTPLSGS